MKTKPSIDPKQPYRYLKATIAIRQEQVVGVAGVGRGLYGRRGGQANLRSRVAVGVCAQAAKLEITLVGNSRDSGRATVPRSSSIPADLRQVGLRLLHYRHVQEDQALADVMV